MAGRRGQFTYEEIKEMIMLYLYKNFSYRDLANYYGVHWTTIYKILNVIRHQTKVMKVLDDLGISYNEYMQKKDLKNLENKVKGAAIAREQKNRIE